jgi:hypothetical protein
LQIFYLAWWLVRLKAGIYRNTGPIPSRRCRNLWVPVAPSGNFTRKTTSRMADRPPRIRTFTLLNFPKGTLFNRVNFRYTTSAFTLSPEPWPLLRGANLSGDWALYAISVPRIKSGAGLAHSFALRLPSPACRQTGTPPHDDALLRRHS